MNLLQQDILLYDNSHFYLFCAGNLHCYICGVVCYKKNCLNGGVDNIRIIKRLYCTISLLVLQEFYEVFSSIVFYSFRSKLKFAYEPSDASGLRRFQEHETTRSISASPWMGLLFHHRVTPQH